jgi:hypothetical protein
MTQPRWLAHLSGIFFFMFMTVFMMSAFAAKNDVEIREISFSYRPDTEAYFALQVADIRTRSNGIINKQAELDAYKQIYQSSDGTDVDFKTWTATTGSTAPKAFRLRLKLRSYQPEATTEIPITITMYAKVGEYFVDQKTYMVDHEHLKKTAKWIPFQTIEGAIPVLAGKEVYEYYSDPVLFGDFLLSIKHQFPVAVKAEVKLTNPDIIKSLEMPVNASQFALEDLQR